jgi:hypothetical protein
LVEYMFDSHSMDDSGGDERVRYETA